MPAPAALDSPVCADRKGCLVPQSRGFVVNTGRNPDPVESIENTGRDLQNRGYGKRYVLFICTKDAISSTTSAEGMGWRPRGRRPGKEKR
jgi:hypothetical protein